MEEQKPTVTQEQQPTVIQVEVPVKEKKKKSKKDQLSRDVLNIIRTTLRNNIELTHIANQRTIFARGALTAARFMAGKPAGLYSMDDVLGL